MYTVIWKMRSELTVYIMLSVYNIKGRILRMEIKYFVILGFNLENIKQYEVKRLE